ncbi:MAG TPA: tetratricopeptide repeat protein [Planctomycetota bacterium]|nr:tetratricopeptide repeat protein [Planctomycetota bacterium]
MKYLYGDSSESPLDYNFIQTLRDAVEFGVQVLQAEQRMLAETGKASERRAAADAELARLEALAGLVQRTLEDTSRTTPESPSGRCAVAIMKAATDLSRGEMERSRAAFAEVLAKLEGQAAKEREACVKALEKMLLKQDLLESRTLLQIQLRNGSRFEGRLTMSAPYGLEAVLDLEIPATHAFARPVRLDRFVEILEMETAEGSWLSKDTKLRPHRLEKYNILEISIAADQMILKLRQGADGSGRGFDLKLRRQPAQVQVFRVDDPPKAAEQPVEIKTADLPKFLALWDSLVAGTSDLVKGRRALLQATLDGKAMKDHEKPSVLLERIVGKMAPIVQEIARRSPSANELVLKRLLGDDRREEIFLSKDELRRKLETLPPSLLRAMEPLGLFPPSAPRPVEEAPMAAASSVLAPGSSDLAAMETPRGQAEVFYKRAMARMKVGEVAAAISDYDRALQLRPDYPEALANRAVARQSAGDWGAAVSDFEAALKAAPTGWRYREKVEHLLEVVRQHAKPHA